MLASSFISRFPSSPVSSWEVSPVANHAMEKKCWTADELCQWTPVSLRSTTAHRVESPETLIPRAEESSEEYRQFPPTFLLLEIIFAHSPYCGVFHNLPMLQGNLLCRPDWLRLRGIVGDRMHDAPGSRVRCLSSVQCVRKDHSMGAPLGLSVPAGPSAARRIPVSFRSSALVWELGQSRQLLFRAHRLYLRLRFGSL